MNAVALATNVIVFIKRDTSSYNSVKWMDNMRVVSLFFCLFTVALSSWGLSQPRITPLGPYGGDVRSLAVHPQRPKVFFLGTPDGQIFVSEDAGDGCFLGSHDVMGPDFRNLERFAHDD